MTISTYFHVEGFSTGKRGTCPCGQLKGGAFFVVVVEWVDAQFFFVGCPPKFNMVPPKNDGCQSRGISYSNLKCHFHVNHGKNFGRAHNS